MDMETIFHDLNSCVREKNGCLNIFQFLIIIFSSFTESGWKINSNNFIYFFYLNGLTIIIVYTHTVTTLWSACHNCDTNNHNCVFTIKFSHKSHLDPELELALRIQLEPAYTHRSKWNTIRPKRRYHTCTKKISG